MAMTHQQRILAAAGKQPVDKLPFGARIDLWYNYHSANGTLPEAYQGWSIIDVLRDLGAGGAIVLGSQAIGTDASGQARIFTLWETTFPGVEVVVRKEGSLTTTEYRTPAGTISSKTEFNREEGYLQGYVIERLFKSEVDYPAIEYLIENTVLAPDYTGYLRLADMQAVLREGTLVERKAFIRSFVKDIRVSGDEAVITYSIPEVPENVSLRKVGVPRIVQYGGR